jgi:hypothetical protein
MAGTITLLASGFGLGFYIPGLLIERKLQRLGFQTELVVFENLMTADRLDKVDDNRKACNASFRVALAAQKLPGDIRRDLDPFAIEQLLEGWARENRTRFICLSGHWVHILDLYREHRGDGQVEADLLHVDSDKSPSWKQLARLKPDYAAAYRETGLYDPNLNAVVARIDVLMSDIVPYALREERLVLHGGGWGIGTFREKTALLEQAGFKLDIAAYKAEDAAEATDAAAAQGERRYWMNDPAWRTWLRNERHEHTFPPFGRLPREGAAVYEQQQDCHGLYHVIRRSKAVISKPGAGALMDSLASATPLVLLEPFGEHERKNAEIWVKNGYGIYFEDWQAAGFSELLLEKLHDQLLHGKQALPDYAEQYAARALTTKRSG